MKYTCLSFAIGIVLFMGACTHGMGPVGNGSFPLCRCHTDTTNFSYGFGSTSYNNADTLLYNDSCSAIRTHNNWDTCLVVRESL